MSQGNVEERKSPHYQIQCCKTSSEKPFTFRQPTNRKSQSPQIVSHNIALSEIIKDLKMQYFDKENKSTKPLKRPSTSVAPLVVRMSRSRYSYYKSQKPSLKGCEELFNMCLVDIECRTLLGQKLVKKNLVKQLSNYDNLCKLKDKKTEEGIQVVQVLHTLLHHLRQMK